MNITKDVMVARIYISETDHGRRRSLMEEILQLLHDQHKVHGVTIFRGIAGFGSRGVVHSADLLRLFTDLPVVIEFFDEPGIVQAAIQVLNGMVPAGHLVCWEAKCNCPDPNP